MSIKFWCLFGLHQWDEIDRREQHYFHNCSPLRRPYKITVVYSLQCKHCGLIKIKEVTSK